MNGYIRKICRAARIAGFKVYGKVIRCLLIHAFLIKALDKVRVVSSVKPGPVNNPCVIISVSPVCIECHLHRIFLIHPQVALDGHIRFQILVRSGKIFDFMVFNHLASIRSPDFVGKISDICLIRINHKRQSARGIQRSNTVAHEIRLHLHYITVHPVCQHIIQLYHNLREKRVIHVRSVVCSFIIQ